jgi:SAM-dependent methyltransferase
MREAEYQALDRLEDSLWWFRGLRGLVLDLLARHRPGPAFALLDAGCGTGGMLAHIAARFPAARLHGLDYAESACALARRKSPAEVRQGSVNELPYAAASFDALVSLDVLDADDVDPPRAVAEFRRVLRPGGIAIVNVAAYQWMLSWHDRAVGQSRRYSRGELRALLAAEGLAPLRSTYWNTLLFPFMVLRRKVFPSGGGGSDVRAWPGPLNALGAGLVAVERGAIRAGVSLPFGGSVLVVARREESR